ncbi:protein kinase domain-containing protein [Streptomyces paludis]|uniref:Serine/threonine protein kinase n=1 Tax=Streptomyces paludis TaxID=2282738 RepID=A0A345HPS4_9ACTN|nr:protein kinase [Streptomyces paludis]AXG78698.1 serine/threonine protein kinase [Streptomyces paludis]
MEKLAAEDPRHIGAYRLLARLGEGGMGRVYLARSDRGRTVAVKLVRQELAAQEQFRGRFRHEVAAARRVGGAWTAPVLDADTEAAVPWVATGYVAGPSLLTVVSGGHGPLPERSVRILASGLAHALQDIHAAGLIHRDLKPSNVLVTIEGPRVIDFGIARALETVSEEPQVEGLTATGTLVGSPGFMAPEQVRGDRVTAASDVFCLGSILAYAATGRPPFGDANTGAHALLFRIAQEEPDLERLPEGLVRLVRGCLQKDPAARPTTRDILVAVGEQTGAGAAGAGTGTGTGREPWLPGALLAELGQHAVRLLEHEDPPGPAPAEAYGTQGAQGTRSEAHGVPAPVGATAPPTPPTPPTGSVSVSAPTPTPAPAHPAAQAQSQAPTTVIPTVAPAPQAYGPPPAYGYPQSGYGYPQPGYPPQGNPPQGNPYGAPPYGAIPTPAPAPTSATPHEPAHEPEPEPRSARFTVVLVTVALIVAVCAGASVYAFMSGDDGSSAKDGKTGPIGSGESPSPSGDPSGGPVPAKYLGTWTGSVSTDSGESPRRLVVRQGELGDTVITLTVDGPAATGGGASYHCVFEAPLASVPVDGEPLHIGPSEVITGEPMTSCTPGPETRLTLTADGGLRRESTSGEPVTYKKQN